MTRNPALRLFLTTGAVTAATVLLGGGATRAADPRGGSPPASSPPLADKRASFTIAIDIGHTPGAPGARSARGKYEYDFNKRLAEQLLPALVAAGFKNAFLVNPKGEEITLLDRTRIAAERKADLFLSIHHDSVHDSLLKRWTPAGSERPEFYCDLHRGYGIFCSMRNPYRGESVRFASLLGRELRAAGLRPSLHHAEKLRGESKTLIDRELGIYEYTNLVVVKTAAMPAALLECGVIVHPDEELELSKPGRQEQTVSAVVRAVIAFAATSTPVAEITQPSGAKPEPTPGVVARPHPAAPATAVGVRGTLGPRETPSPAAPAARDTRPPVLLPYEGNVPPRTLPPKPAASPTPTPPP